MKDNDSGPSRGFLAIMAGLALAFGVGLILLSLDLPIEVSIGGLVITCILLIFVALAAFPRR